MIPQSEIMMMAATAVAAVLLPFIFMFILRKSLKSDGCLHPRYRYIYSLRINSRTDYALYRPQSVSGRHYRIIISSPVALCAVWHIRSRHIRRNRPAARLLNYEETLQRYRQRCFIRDRARRYRSGGSRRPRHA